MAALYDGILDIGALFFVDRKVETNDIAKAARDLKRVKYQQVEVNSKILGQLGTIRVVFNSRFEILAGTAAKSTAKDLKKFRGGIVRDVRGMKQAQNELKSVEHVPS